MRIVTGMFIHETTTFSVIRADMEAFKSYNYYKGKDILPVFKGTNSSLGGFLNAAESHPGIELIPVVAAGNFASGKVTTEAYETIKKDLIDGIKNAGDIDGILLALHGAMVTDDYQDGEGALLKAVRGVVGEEIPIVTTLDLHGNITQLMVGMANAFFGYDTNPHVDNHERGIEAFQCLLKILKGELQPVMALAQPPIIPHSICVRTDSGPLVDLFKAARQWESRPGVINVSIFGGWAHADIYDAGLSFVAVTDGNQALAQEIANDLSVKAMEKIQEFLPSTLVEIPEAVEMALAAPEGPVILAEIGDSPAAGSSGDGTATLGHLLEVGAKSVCILLKDPEAVAEALRVGVGGHFEMKVGGKTDDYHGAPLMVKGVIRALTDGRYVNRGPKDTGVKCNIGRTAVIKLGDDFEIVLTEIRISPTDPEVFRHAGIEPTLKKIVVLKSGGHFRAGYTSMAKMIIDVNTPGVSSPNLKQFEYRNVRRPIFPLDEL